MWLFNIQVYKDKEAVQIVYEKCFRQRGWTQSVEENGAFKEVTR